MYFFTIAILMAQYLIAKRMLNNGLTDIDYIAIFIQYFASVVIALNVQILPIFLFTVACSASIVFSSMTINIMLTYYRKKEKIQFPYLYRLFNFLYFLVLCIPTSMYSTFVNGR